MCRAACSESKQAALRPSKRAVDKAEMGIEAWETHPPSWSSEVWIQGVMQGMSGMTGVRPARCAT
jgi:hypothetical protein